MQRNKRIKYYVYNYLLKIYIYTHKIYKSICGYSCSVHSFFNATYFLFVLFPYFYFIWIFQMKLRKRATLYMIVV